MLQQLYFSLSFSLLLFVINGVRRKLIWLRGRREEKIENKMKK